MNSVFLISLCFTIVVDSLKRFLQTEPVSNPSIVLIVGSIGFLINVVGLGLLSTHGKLFTFPFYVETELLHFVGDTICFSEFISTVR